MAVTTGKVRLSYVHVWEPQVPQGGGDPKYSVTLLIPKSDVNTINAIYAAMEAAKQEGISSAWAGQLPPIIKNPLYDGDGVRPSGEPFGPECKGHLVMTASAKNQPSVVDVNVQPVLNRADVYSGCFARVSINFFAYNQAGNRGIGCGLNCIQKVGDGEPLAGGVSAQEAFGGSNAYASAMQQFQQPATPVFQPQQAPAAMPYQQPAAQQYPSQQTMPVYQTPMQMPQQYQQPATPQYQAPQQLDPITGLPFVGGVMGI